MTEGRNMKENNNLAWEEIKTNHIIQNEWIDFRESTYRFPDGREIGPFYSYSRRDYVVIVASDEEGNYLCVRQFRQGIKEVTTEFPAGGIERKDGKEYAVKDEVNAPKDVAEDARRKGIESKNSEDLSNKGVDNKMNQQDESKQGMDFSEITNILTEIKDSITTFTADFKTTFA